MGRTGKKWRPLKEKPMADEWPDGWGDGMEDLGNGQPKPHYSLRAEAQNTERRHNQQRSSTPRIRREPVQFISVGPMNLDQSFKKLQVGTPSTPPINLGGLSQGEVMSRLSTQELQPTQSAEVASSRDPEAEIVQDAGGKKDYSRNAFKSEVNSGLFFTDTIGTEKPLRTGFSQSIIRSQSPCLSDSSEEVIVFAGRGQVGGAPLLNRGFSQDGDRRLQLAHSTTNDGATIGEDPVDESALAVYRDTGSTGAVLEALDDLNHKTGRKKRRRRKGQSKNYQLQAQALDDEATTDYIANIDPTDSFPIEMNHAMNLGNENVDETDNTGELTDKEAVTIYPQQDDFPSHLKTSEDLDGLGVLNVTEILSKRDNLSGTQYLAVDEKSSAAIARWISVDVLKSAGAENHIRTYESKELEDEAGSTGADGSGTDESQGQVAADLQDDLDDLLDEKDSWDRRVEGMSDEKIARLLSKQEELGLGSSELLLLDDIDEGETGGENDDEIVLSGIGTSSRARRNGERSSQPGNNFSYTNAIPEEFNANNYGTFDIMDLNRPSLGPLPKGRNRITALGLDDDDESANRMQVLWENDRSKKKIRKQEREELRSQGLLGHKSKDKAISDMSPGDIKMAIREFLLSSNPRLVLPPMGPRDRRMVHEIAHVFRLKSRSFGKDGTRFPVLLKTDEISIYDESVVDALERRFGFRGRKDKGLQHKEPRSRNPRGGGNSRFTYQDGDIVGATAPELGVENKGRAMLEKMGWSKGTALGALNNKGIMQPLVHVVRNSKAGLG